MRTTIYYHFTPLNKNTNKSHLDFVEIPPLICEKLNGNTASNGSGHLFSAFALQMINTKKNEESKLAGWQFK